LGFRKEMRPDEVDCSMASDPPVAKSASRIARPALLRRLALGSTALAVALGLPWVAIGLQDHSAASDSRIEHLQAVWAAASEPCPEAAEQQPAASSQAAAQASAKTAAKKSAAVEQLPAPYKTGELALYDVRWGLFKAGEIRLEVLPQARLSGRPAWHFAGKAQSSALVRVFYRAEDSFDSLVDQQSFLPVGLHIEVDESGERGERSVSYDHQQGIAHYLKDRTHHKHGPKTTCRKDPLDSQALDVFAALYRLRTVELEPGKTVHLPVYDNGKSWIARVEVLPRTQINTGLGRQSAIPLRISSQIEGKLNSKKALRIWLSDDEHRVMLRFEAALGWGKLRAGLRGYRPAAGQHLLGRG